MVGVVLALHVLALYGLLQVAAVRQAVLDAAPMFVDLLAPPEPVPPAALPAPQIPPRRSAPMPVQAPVPVPVSIIATPQDTTAPAAAFTVQAEEAPPAPAAPADPVQAVAAPPTPPPPRTIPASAVRYIEPPQVVYPRLSRRNGETGRVLVRAYIGAADGVPRSVRIDRSSGFLRLDEAALSAVQQARFKPHTENGQAIDGWTVIPIEFELEN